jgi:hypothetical protein
MKQLLEYSYLMAAIALMGVYALWGKQLSANASYGLIGGMIIFSFLFSIRRTMRRANEQRSKRTNSNDTV